MTLADKHDFVIITLIDFKSMLRRLFFAIQVPKNIKSNFISLQNELKEDLNFSIKWVKEENLHITLFFYGSAKEENIEKIILDVRKIRHNSFSINLYKLDYFPDRKNPKMLWVFGKSNDIEGLTKKIKKQTKPYSLEEGDDFIPHITLGRIDRWSVRRKEEIYSIQKKINIKLEVSSFHLMESVSKEGKLSYNKIETFKLN